MIDFQLFPKNRTEFVEGPQWVSEPKLNGIRMGCFMSEDGPIWLLRRTRLEVAPSHIPKSLPDIPVGSFLDGEFCYGLTSRAAYGVLARTRPPALGEWHLFDFLQSEQDQSPLALRRRRLEGLDLKSPIELVPQYALPPAAIYPLVKRIGFEGVVAKRRDRPYRPGRRVKEWRRWK